MRKLILLSLPALVISILLWQKHDPTPAILRGSGNTTGVAVLEVYNGR